MPPISAPRPRTTGAGERLDDGDVEPEAPRRGGHLAADEAGADHDHPLRRGDQVGPQGQAVVDRAEDVDTGEVGPGRDAAGRRAGGDHHAVDVEVVARGSRHPPDADVEGSGRLPESPLDVEVLGDREVGSRRLLGAGQHLLGERRAVVGEVRLGAEHDDLALVALGTERLGGPEPRERGADDGDATPATYVAHPSVPWSSPTLGAPSSR